MDTFQYTRHGSICWGTSVSKNPCCLGAHVLFFLFIIFILSASIIVLELFFWNTDFKVVKSKSHFLVSLISLQHLALLTTLSSLGLTVIPTSSAFLFPGMLHLCFSAFPSFFSPVLPTHILRTYSQLWHSNLHCNYLGVCFIYTTVSWSVFHRREVLWVFNRCYVKKEFCGQTLLGKHWGKHWASLWQNILEQLTCQWKLWITYRRNDIQCFPHVFDHRTLFLSYILQDFWKTYFRKYYARL